MRRVWQHEIPGRPFARGHRLRGACRGGQGTFSLPRHAERCTPTADVRSMLLFACFYSLKRAVLAFLRRDVVSSWRPTSSTSVQSGVPSVTRCADAAA